MIRNLLSNALKYTKRGKVLLGCRRRKGKLRIEVCDYRTRNSRGGASRYLRRVSSTRQRRART
ncbi:MAG: hypothetical protein WDN50_13040 [Bradyrhizobium sp.]